MFEKLKLWWENRKSLKHEQNFVKKHGFTHACPSCNKWEHEGNTIYTEIYDEGTDKRTCKSCGYVWRSLFCPAGHAWLEGYEWDGKGFVCKK